LRVQGLKLRTNTMVPDVAGKRGGKGKGRAAAAADDADDEAPEAVAGDAEGGAALAEEAGPTQVGRSATHAHARGTRVRRSVFQVMQALLRSW
jgi:hypothetical protein